MLRSGSKLPRVGATIKETEEHKYDLTQGRLGKSKLAQHDYEEGHKIFWKESEVLQIEPNITYRK
jgi:hypothetical protein